MCGIAGLVADPGGRIDQDLVRRMARELAHRGPDAEGYYFDGRVGLGHRRLAVIDTSEEANQPLFNENRSVAVIFNGEIYNFREIGEELRSRGHHFRTRSDTEVIAHAWEEFGPSCVERLRGMFAIGIYDAEKQQLFLARDRLGKKPLYYATLQGGFAFASEIKALRHVPALSLELDLPAVGEYAAYGNTLGERTIYSGIRRLLPGHTLLVDLRMARAEPRVDRYWEACQEVEDGRTEDEWLEELDGVLSEAVRLRLISDVPLGAFLSGGIDSSLVVAYMAQHSTEPVRTFTMAFSEASHDESSHARAVADHFGTNHHEQLITPDAAGILDTLVDVYDEPFADESAIPTYYLSKLTREHVTVALSGDGGDEVFHGYLRYPYSLWGDRLSGMLTGDGRRLLASVGGKLSLANRLRRPLDRLSRRGFEHYNHALGYSDELLGILHPDVRRGLPVESESRQSRSFRSYRPPSLVDAFSRLDLEHYLPDDVLVKVDRASMAHSLEVRCPLLDHHVVELGLRIPAQLKLRGLKGKLLLRKLLARRLPQEFVGRQKAGFGVPLGKWFRHELAPVLAEMLSDDTSPAWQILDRNAVASRLRAHRAGAADLHVSLWRSLVFWKWSQRWLK